MPRDAAAAHCVCPMKKFLLALCALPLVALLSSCGNQVQVNVGVELVSLDRGQNGQGSAVVRFVNPTVVAYNFARSTHQVWLDGRVAGVIEISAPLGLPAQRSIEQTGKFTADKSANLSAGSANYRIESRVAVTLWSDTTQNEKFSGAGTVVVK